MSLLQRLGWRRRKDATSHGAYASVDDDSEHLVDKESSIESLQDQHRALLASHRRLKLWLRGVCLLLVLFGLALAVLIVNTRAAFEAPLPLSPVPMMPMKMVTFERNDTFAGPSTPENDQAWSAMMPAGDGFIVVNSPEQYDIPPGRPTQHGDVYDISVFHQLHCLKHIRDHYYLTQLSLHANNTDKIEEMLLRPQEDHVHHCFDYLRQGLMCMGDMTIEWPRTEDDGERSAVDGWGITHECKSWDAIMGFMEENDVASRIWTV